MHNPSNIKKIIILFLILSTLIGCGTYDRFSSVYFILDENIRNKGYEISLVDSIPDKNVHPLERIRMIENGHEGYRFVAPSESYMFKVKFKDSTEKFTANIHNSEFHTYKITLDTNNNLSCTDITEHLRNIAISKFILFAFVWFLLIKIIPAGIIILPKKILKFLLYYGIAQIIYFILYIVLALIPGFAGLIISLVLFFVTVGVDYKILSYNYLEKKGFGRVMAATIVTTILSIILGVYLLSEFRFIS